MLFGLVFSVLGGGRVVSPELLRYMLWLTLPAVLASTLLTVSTTATGWFSILRATFFISSALCVPVPVIIVSVLAWKFGFNVFTSQMILADLWLFGLWATFVALLSWSFALGYRYVHARREGLIR
jgi:hypothetical protein